MKKLIIILVIFSSCKVKQDISSKTDLVTKDTIYNTKVIKEIERFTDTLRIENPCDSLGRLKPFSQLVKVPQGKIKIFNVNNGISAEIDLEGYKSTLEKRYESKYQSFISEYNEKNTVYKTPIWHWLVHVISVLLILLLLRFQK